jgi:hypothetical protein
MALSMCDSTNWMLQVLQIANTVVSILTHKMNETSETQLSSVLPFYLLKEIYQGMA